MRFILRVPASNEALKLIEELSGKSEELVKLEIQLPQELSIGMILLIARKLQNLSQEDVGFIVGFSQKKISRIENGESLDFIAIVRLCELYSISVEELIATASISE